MNRKMLDILACPIDKHAPLELYGCEGSDPVEEGSLYCTECTRFYPIIEGIPIMLPDELRDKDQETEFLRANGEKLPEKITKKALPWHL